MKNAILLFLTVASFTSLSAQCEIIFSYDAAGNRIKREDPCPMLVPGNEDRNTAGLASDFKMGDLTIIPNPTSGTFQIQAEGVSSNSTILITDAKGSSITARALYDGFFDLSAFPAGIYQVLLQDGKEIRVGSVVKLR